MKNISVLNSSSSECSNSSCPNTSGWHVIPAAFKEWLEKHEHIFEPGLAPEPTIKVLMFLALFDAGKACSYDEIREILAAKKVIQGVVSDNTLRTSVLNLGKTLDKSKHQLELKSFRGRFQIIPRQTKSITAIQPQKQDAIILLLDSTTAKAEEIAFDLIKKSMLPFHALYFLERSARWWEIFSSSEAEIRVQYESQAWERLHIKDRLLNESSDSICIVGLAPGEGLAEIEILKKILIENESIKIHYLAIDSSQRLLRDHINLLKETLTTEIENGRLLCAGVTANIFSEIRESIEKIREEFYARGIIKSKDDFLPSSSSLLVTYLGNCLGNNCQDQETEIFSIIYSAFQNRPLEFLVGVSVMRSAPDEYKRNWDDFLLQTPKHLLETKKLLQSSRPIDVNEIPEFYLPQNGSHERCPPVVPESYIVRHKISGQIYRFYYQLAYELKLSQELKVDLRPLPKGTLILLYSIIKYDMKTLVAGIEKCGLFKIDYDDKYHQIVDTINGVREYAVFSAFCEK